MRKRCGVFGNNAPLWRSMDSTFRPSIEQQDVDTGEWPDFEISENAASATGGGVDLDQVQSEIAADVASDATRRSLAVLAKGGFNRPDEKFPSGTSVELYLVTATTEVSRAAFRAVGQGVRDLALSGEHLDTTFFKRVPRNPRSTPNPN